MGYNSPLLIVTGISTVSVLTVLSSQPLGVASYPPFILFLLSLWPLYVLVPWLLFLWPIFDRGFRFWAYEDFRDEGCDESREANEWGKEQLLMALGSVMGLGFLFLLFLYLG